MRNVGFLGNNGFSIFLINLFWNKVFGIISKFFGYYQIKRDIIKLK